MSTGYFPIVWFLLKVLGFIFFFIWLRGTLPRLRYDQFMKLGWKVLIPVSLVWILLVAAAIRTCRPEVADARQRIYYIAIGMAVFFAIFYAFPQKKARRRRSSNRRTATRRFPRAASRCPRSTWWSRRPAPVAAALTTQPPRKRGAPWLASSTPSRASGSPSRRCSRRRRPRSTRSTSVRCRRASTAGTCSTGTRTAWRSASAASCAPGPARPTPSTSRAPTTPTSERFSPGERYASVYQINYLRCIFCGLCIEACPTRALTMTNEYELADDSREALIFTKEDLLAPLLPGMEQPPHPMRLGTTDQDYYVGGTPRRRETAA